MQTKYTRNNGIDILRLLCAFMIICIHESFPGEIGEVAKLISRVAVPVFFMITGFYYNDICAQNRQGQQIKRTVILTTLTMVFYLVYECAKHILIYKDFEIFLNNVISFEAIKRLFIYNYATWGGQLWYLRALIYVLLIALLLKRFINKKWFLYIAIGLYIIGLFIGIYSTFVFGTRLSMFRERNFLFVGLPFFVFGINAKRLVDKFTNLTLCIFTLIFCLLSVVEYYVMYALGSYGEFYISTPFFALALFLMMYQVYENRTLSKVEKILTAIGRKYSLSIFVTHLALINFVNYALDFVNISWLYYFAPFLLFILCIVVAIAYYKIKSILLLKLKRK